MQIELLKEEEAALLKNLIGQSEKIVLCCHQNPDGDALGSCLALGEYLKQQGKTPLIAVPDAYPDFLQWLPESQTIVRYDKHKETVEDAMANAELVFCLDFNRADRLGNDANSITCKESDDRPSPRTRHRHRAVHISPRDEQHMRAAVPCNMAVGRF